VAVAVVLVLRFGSASTNLTAPFTFRSEDPDALEVGTVLLLHCFLVYLLNICHSNRKQMSAKLQIFFINSPQTLHFIIADP
jgi:hypothetical protein